MKQKYFLFALLSLIVASCTNQEIECVDAGQVQVTADIAKSRVSFNESGDKTYAYWQTGDAITLSTPTQVNLNYTATVSEDDATVATFAPEAGGLKDIDGENVYACYPAATITDGVVNLPATNNWTDAKPLPFAYAVSSITESKVDLSFEYVFAFLKLTLSAGALENAASSDGGKSVHEIVVKSASEALGIVSGTFNFADENISITEESKEVSLTLGTAFNPSEETERSVYIPILSQSGEVAMTISLKHQYDGGEDVLLELEKQTPAVGFVAGHVYTLTLSGNDEITEPGIYTLEDLNAFRDARNAGGDVSQWKNAEGVINIFADIDMSSVPDWQPIASIASDEVLEGNGYTLKGLAYTENYDTEAWDDWGLVKSNAGTIQNLNLDVDLNIENPKNNRLDRYGAIAYRSESTGKIINCHVDIDAVCYWYIGGIACYNNGGIIEQCSTKGEIKSSTEACGICVWNEGVIKECTNYCNVTSESSASGIVGIQQKNIAQEAGQIINCTNMGNITTGTSFDHCGAGGIVTSLYDGAVTGCVNQGNVSGGEQSGFVGGIVGVIQEEFDGTLADNTNSGTVNDAPGDDINAIGKDLRIKETAVSVYIPGVITEDSYHAVVWVDGEARFVGSSVDEGFQDYPMYSEPSVLSSFAINEEYVYMVGHQTSTPGTMDYYERGTIWKNGTIIFQEEQTNSVVRDLCVSGSDVYAVGDLNGTPVYWENEEAILLPNKGNPQTSWANAVSVQNGNVYVMGYEFNGSDASSITVLWKNGELTDVELGGEGLCMYLTDNDIYCLFEKNEMTYLYKNGEITDTGLKTWTGFGGPHFQTLFVDGEDVYIIGQQDGIAKIWKNGVVSLLTTEDNQCALTGICVYNKDVYVVGYDFAYDENNNQSTVVKLWKNGEESIIDTSSWSHAYPFGVAVVPKN